MLGKKALMNIIKVLEKSAKRALNLRLPGFSPPYYVSFLMRHIDRISLTASAGSIFERDKTRKRVVYCDCRVGSYKNDQNYWIKDLSEDESISSKYTNLPLEDDNIYAFETTLWRLTEARYREALRDFQEKQTLAIFSDNPVKNYISFWNSKPIKSTKFTRRKEEDISYWEKLVKKLSKFISNLPEITYDSVSVTIEHEIKIFVSTEKSVIVEPSSLYSISIELQCQSWDNQVVSQNLVINKSSKSDIPDFNGIKKLINEKYRKLKELALSRQIYSYSGPALLYPIPAGLLFHETLGHRLEGDRLLKKLEGLTFKGQLGRRVLAGDLLIQDDPTLKSFNGEKCWGAYDFDDQGIPAQAVTLIEDGILRNFLTSRSQCYKKNFKPNGHARSSDANPPMSRMGVFIIRSKKNYSLDTLKKILISEIKRQNKPYGVIIEDALDGETKTSSYDPQTFSGKISYCKLIYPDGSEEVVRGLSFVGTPLQSLNQIIAVGDKLEVDNSFCVAESGSIPVTTISPAIILRNIELQASEEPSQPPFILPKPKPSRS